MKLAESINLNGSNINTTINNNNETIYYTYWSERGTTVMARAMLKHTTTSRNKLLSQKDTVAASLILQSYLNYHKLELHDL
jgi:RNase H-fold protein (predicted Holliday junction resolvase)